MISNRILGMGMATFALLALYMAGRSEAGEDNKKYLAQVQAVADAIKGGKKGDDLKKLVAVAKGSNLEELMHLFALRSKGGFGFGPKAQTRLDGIESRLRDLERSGVKAADLENLEYLAYQVRAIAEISLLHAPQKAAGSKKPADFVQWTKDMRDAAEALNAAVTAKNLPNAGAAIKKMNATCATCHGVFRN